MSESGERFNDPPSTVNNFGSSRIGLRWTTVGSVGLGLSLNHRINLKITTSSLDLVKFNGFKQKSKKNHNGPLNSNSSLFNLRHLQKLNLDSNNFSSSIIPSEFGQLVRLTHLNLSFSFLHGRISSEISWLSNLVSLDLSSNYLVYFVGGDYSYKLLDLRRIHLEALVQNMTYLRELHLDDVNISPSLPQSLANLSSLTSLTLYDCNLQGKFPPNIFLLPRIQSIDLSYNPKLVGFLPKFQSRSSLKELCFPNTNFSGECRFD